MFKGRVVFQGNRVFDQNYNYAIVQDLGSSLATLQAAKAVDFFGCLHGHALDVLDAEQAYIQADMNWVCLPPEARPAWWHYICLNMRRPVRRLKTALLRPSGRRCILGANMWRSRQIGWFFLSAQSGHLATIIRSCHLCCQFTLMIFRWLVQDKLTFGMEVAATRSTY